MPDDRSQVAEALWGLTDVADLVLTTGGTGFAPRDVTPGGDRRGGRAADAGAGRGDARGVAPRLAARPAVARARAASPGGTLIVNFPGSPKACAECFDAVAAALPHGVELLTERPTEHP